MQRKEGTYCVSCDFPFQGVFSLCRETGQHKIWLTKNVLIGGRTISQLDSGCLGLVLLLSKFL